MLLFFKRNLWLLVFVLPVEAATLHTYPDPKPRWDTDDHKIMHRSVCDDYTKGSLQYRECRKKAKLFFKDQCQAYKMKYDRSSVSKREEIKPVKDMFCYSARNFRI
jgi:hypothetical protein